MINATWSILFGSIIQFQTGSQAHRTGHEKKKIDQDRILIEDGKIVETAVVRVLDGAIVLSMCEPV